MRSALISDEAAMEAALALGEQGRLTAPPNPWVGCVIVNGGEIVGRGFHAAAGRPHAEPNALADAGDRARGATAYVTLEPCDHHGRTPPCTEALLAAGVARVVAAVVDPDPNVSGRGLERLRAAGVEVNAGVGTAAAEASLRPYLHQRRTGRPFYVLKSATSLDGRTAAADGTSKWITGPEARADGHRVRAESQAVIVGSGTALADQPALTVRDIAEAVTTRGSPQAPALRQPLRVLLDATGRTPATGPLFDPALAATLVVTTAAAPSDVKKAWLDAGADVEEVPAGPGSTGVSLEALGSLLVARSVLQAMVEGGAAVHASFLRAGLADRLVLYVGGAMLGAAGRPLAADPGPATLADAARWRVVATTLVGTDARLDCEPVKTVTSGGYPRPPVISGGSPRTPAGAA